MGANAFEYNVRLNLNAETKLAKSQIGELQRQLQDVSNLKLNFSGIEKLTDEINEASTAAMKLQTNLQNALNPDTGTLDFSKFNNSILKSGDSIDGLAQSLLKIGPQGEKAFVSLADSISRSEVPLMRTNKLINGLWDNLKKTAGWQVSSSVIHGIMGQYQQAMGYAKALDKSLTDIRIVTGQSADQMARFAKEANAAAKKLSTTTTDYTNASLIYYQQGLSDAEVKKRSDITIKMANATGTSASKVSDQLTSIWNNFDNGTKSLEHYADVMTALGAATASSTDEIAKGIQKFAAISDTVGLSYEYAASALATITATTRESADTVGNSLKTLFSRIQGLQLGDTLDDGTTLNKYSTALAKVGISIKDASGNLRDMNSILDDMGAKWHTLAEDQQMALAQTVGGVRQYTQIMTLMENWDFFKENLNTANSATGTLTMQADIYAESWDAASKRMRASMESVWDTLIDSDSFKKVLNIGSTIADGINEALTGIGGGGGLLSTALGVVGTVFKTQISQTLTDAMHTVTHLTPKAMQAERDKRSQTIDKMIATVNQPGFTPYMGEYERQRTVDILTMQKADSENRSHRRSKMSTEAQELDVALEKSLNELYDRRKTLASEMDVYDAQMSRGRQADKDILKSNFQLSSEQKINESQAKDQLKALQQQREEAEKNGQSTTELEAKILEEQNRIRASENYDFGLALLRDIEDSGATADKNASLNRVLESIGKREAQAEVATADIAARLANAAKGDADIYRTEVEQRLLTSSKDGKDVATMFADLIGLTAQERKDLRDGKSLGDRQGVGVKFNKAMSDFKSYLKDLDENGITDPQERSKLIRDYLQTQVGNISQDALAGLGVNTTLQGMSRGGAQDVYQGAKGMASAKIIDKNIQGAVKDVKEEQENLRNQNYASTASAITGLSSGIFQNAAGIQGAQGAFNSLLNGDIIGAGAGAASAFYNFKWANKNATEAFQDLDPLSKNLKDSARKGALLKQQKDLLTEREAYEKQIEAIDEDLNKRLISKPKNKSQRTANENRKKEAEKRKKEIREQYDFEASEKYLTDIASELKGLEKVKPGKFSGLMNTVGNGLDFVAKHAESFSIGLQAAQMAMTATAKINDYFYNQNLRNAQKSQTAVNELSGAYQNAQNNHAKLLDGIEEYNTQTAKLADSNLKGAAKTAAIFDQNQAALNLIDKYDITDFSRVGDTIKINSAALEKAEEDSIQSAATAKYAMGLAKVDAKEDQNKYLEEKLERDLVFDEKGWQNFGYWSSGAAGMTAGAMIGTAAVPIIGTAIGAIAGAAIGTLVGAGISVASEGAGEIKRYDSFVDKAITKTRETGSTSWMDDYNGDEFSASQLKKLKEQRSEIKNLAASQEAAEQMDEFQRESIANDLLANNDRTEKFKYADKLVDGLAAQAESWEKLGRDYGALGVLSKDRIEAAQKINSELGLSGAVSWKDDKQNKVMTYTTADGQTGMISYDTLSRLEGTKQGKSGADAYIEQMMNVYDRIKEDSTVKNSEAAAAGILSLLSSGNFDNATMAEIKAAQTYIKNMQTDGQYDQKKIAEILGAENATALQKQALEQGYTKEEWDPNAINYDADGNVSYGKNVIVGDTNAYLQNIAEYKSAIQQNLNDIQGYQSWAASNAQVANSMSQATMKNLYSQLVHIQGTSGDVQGYLNNLSEILEGVDPNKTGQIMQALTSLDWSDWNIDDSIIEIMKEFGMTIDNTNNSLENMVNIIRDAANSIPNLEQEMTSLTQIMGSIADKKVGDTLDDNIIQALKDQKIDIEDYVFTTWDGKNILTKNPDAIKKDIKEEAVGTYEAYMDKINKVENSTLLKGMTDSDKAAKLAEMGTLTQSQFEEKITQNSGEGIYDPKTEQFVAQVLEYDQELALSNNIRERNELENYWTNYIEKNGKLYETDANGNIIKEATNRTLQDYRIDMNRLNSLNESIASQYQDFINTVEAAADPAEAKKIAEQYASTFDSYTEAMNSSLIQEMIKNGHLNDNDVLIATASQYAELTDDIIAFYDAIASGDEVLANRIKGEIELGTAMQSTLKAYQDATGKKASLADIQSTVDKLKEDEEIKKLYSDHEGKWNELALANLAEDSMFKAVGKESLNKYGNQWLSDINNIDPDNSNASKKGYQSAAKMGKAMQQYLGLMNYNITNIDSERNNPIVEAIQKGIADVSQIIKGNTAEAEKLRVYLVKQSTAGQSLSNKLSVLNGGTATNYDAETSAAFTKMRNAAKDGKINATDEDVLAINEEFLNEVANGSLTMDEYQAAIVESSGGRLRANDTGYAVLSGKPINGVVTTTKTPVRYNRDENKWKVIKTTTGNDGTITETTEDYDENKHGKLQTLDGADIPDAAPRGGGRGGGGGGPQKVAVKSAQEGITRYKTIDQKTAQNEMLKTSALQAKDLLYGKSKINQLEKINLLLRKQQQLTSERITEELDYLEKDKKRMEEVIARYNKDLKEEEKITLEFNGNGIITNYKQVIGKWGEELSSFYLDGELTAEEGKKAKELQKKIADLNTVISDYESSLQELATSLEQYENTLYEMLSTEVEALNHQVEYNLDLSNDNLSYLNFYSSAIKDSMGSVIDYIELMNARINESITQIDIYKQGYNDLMTFVDENPLQLWATQGVEDIITAEQVATLRSYRDGLISVYNNALSVRKEIEDQVLRVFDYWNKKIDKNLNSISKFTDMLAQFKDIVNVVGKDVLGLSNNFMQMFEQQSIDQSLDNIKASRIQYENLIKVYEDAQEKLNTARMSGNERDIEYWEEIVDKTQKSMEEMQNTLLTTLQHSLNAIAEQFTNTITIIMDEFNESVYKFKGLDGLIADYEQIKEYQDLMVADYEKIYSLNKLNRDLEKTLNNSNIVNGKQKLLEFQQKINEINKSNVELSQYELEYLQAEYELKVAEMELENARNSKDNVMLSKDSEGNWSYIYTQNVAVVEEAEQKVEDALYKMQQVSQEYTEEMSSAMMTISQQMRDEITELSIQDFESAEAYYAEIERIQDKYSAQLANREIELNKAISNSANLYEQDWMNYSEATGYKISAHEDWIDSFRETTFGGLLGSSSDISNYSDVIANSTDKMNEALGKAASTYFVNADKALNTYGTSLKEFGTTANVTTNQIINSSKNAIEEVTKFGSVLVDKFSEISDIVESELAEWTDEIGNKLEEMLSTIKEINNLISDSASKELPDTYEIIGQEEAVSRLTNANFQHEEFKNWKWNQDGEVAIYQGNSEGWNLTEFNANLVKQVNEALQKYANTPTTDESGRQMALEELNKLIKDYWTFRRIIEKIYDPTNLNIDDLQIPDTGIATQMDTGGYTGEWGNEGKYAILHEKELVLNKDDTANFLDALNISRDVIHSIIEMNAKASSLAFGNLMPSSIQDMSQQLEQQVSIVAEFPGVTDRDEISEAFDNLINTASQYANRFKI